MKKKSPSTIEWKRLYELMSEIKKLEPWNEFREQDIFAVQNPETEEIGFVSIMGSKGEHYSITVYRGEEGFRKFWDFQENYSSEDEFAFQKIMEIPQLQASFENQETLYREDHDIIKKMSLTFRSKYSWPMFRSYEPGFVPWFINSADARFLIIVLEQTIDVYMRVKKNTLLLYPEDEDAFLLRKRVKKGNETQWQDFNWYESDEDLQPVETSLEISTLEKLKKIPRRNIYLEIDVFMTPNPVQDNDSRPYFPYMLMVVETTDGMILGQDLLSPSPSLDDMWQKMASFIAKIFIKISLLPEEIYVESEQLYQSLIPLRDHLDLSIVLVEELLEVPEARKSLLDFLNKKNN